MAFTFKLEREDGAPRRPADARYRRTNWHPGETIPLGRERMLRVIDVLPAKDNDDEPVLVVIEDEPFRL